jgi:hypothetical protein
MALYPEGYQDPSAVVQLANRILVAEVPSVSEFTQTFGKSFSLCSQRSLTRIYFTPTHPLKSRGNGRAIVGEKRQIHYC